MNYRILFLDDRDRACSVYRTNATMTLVHPLAWLASLTDLPKDLHFLKVRGSRVFQGCTRCIFIAYAAATLPVPWVGLHCV